MDRKLWTQARTIAARHDPAARDDLAQDLAVAVLERDEALRNPGAWLERVGRHAAIDRWRIDRRRGELLEQVELPDQPADPESVVLGREQRALVRRAVAELPRPQRRAALARFHADLSYEEAARQLGTPVATARTRVHRALAALRARLGSLRALFVCPGYQTAALGLAFVVAQAPAGPRASVITSEEAASPVALRTRHLAAARVIAAEATVPLRSQPVASTRPAPADDPEPEPEPVQRFVFDGDQISGDRQSPDGEIVQVSPHAAQPSLIEIRRHFVPELLKTLEDL
jgi:RNA polymerase sigma-70 factor (ECF subfamily)